MLKLTKEEIALITMSLKDSAVTPENSMEYREKYAELRRKLLDREEGYLISQQEYEEL